ncbi:LamG-like jellyroll fold domain-containing protein [Sungkyunkwania multivorans]|uniref:LamG-like jellyroll fold domain-containing protein n=1 Tax=Sungkyunkwania multivorans TaxID=1173618 RepID=A0ABW3D2X6_9FLAO
MKKLSLVFLTFWFSGITINANIDSDLSIINESTKDSLSQQKKPTNALRPPACTSANLELWLRADIGGLSWTDQSGNGVGVAGGSGATLSYINYNEAITFNDNITSVYNLSGANFASGNNDRTIIVVTRPNTLDDAFVFGYGASTSTNNRYFALGTNSNNPGRGLLFENDDETYSNDGFWDNDVANINSIVVDGGNAEFYRDGNGISLFADTSPFNTGNVSTGVIGGSFSTSDDFWDGEIAEVLVYNRVLTSTEQQEVDTYLAIKYGVTLTKDYVANSASITAPLWDYGNTGGFDNNIAGIGRENCQGLQQYQSSSTNPTSIVSIGLTSLLATNAANISFNEFGAGNPMNNEAFMLWGHNNGSASFSSADGHPTQFILDKKWKVYETGFVDVVEIAIDVNNTFFDVPFSPSYYFIYDSDNDGDLSDETATLMYDDGTNGDNTANDGVYTAVGINFTNDTLFSISIPNLDTDSDNIPDSVDIDDDNDGIIDIREQGNFFALPGSGVSFDPLSDFDGDTVPLYLDDNDTPVVGVGIGDDNNSIEPGWDTDGDGIPNFRDQDSDGDGVPDNVEGQATGSFVIWVNTDSDNDGLVDSYDTNAATAANEGIFPLIDTLNDGTLDFLNSDADGDGFNDGAETGIPLSGFDYDGDGMDNFVDDVPGFNSPEGTIDDPTILPDDDGDLGVGGGDVNYRDALPDFPDTDGDTFTNDVDLDDDNDGIPDFQDVIQIDVSGTCSFPSGEFKLSRNSPPESGTFGQVGAVWRFPDVVNYQGVILDALVELTAKTSGATLVSIDDDTNNFNDWRPRVRGDGSGIESCTFTVDLVITGTSIPFTVPRFGGIALDIDGGSFNEVVSIFSPDYWALNAVTDILHTSVSGGEEQFASTGPEYSSINRDPEALFFFGYVNTQTFTVKVGTTNNRTRLFNLSFSECLVQDLDDPVVVINNGNDNDNDGVPNHLDLDSDGDGMPDSYEVGHGLDADYDGRVDYTNVSEFGTNGILDALETTPDSGTLNYIFNNQNEGDTKADYVDIDSDGDGIPDNIEAQPTTGYLAPSVVRITHPTLGAPFELAINISNPSNGYNTSYIDGLGNNSFNLPVDTDGDGTPDYLDTDSDDDGLADILENGMSNGASGVDTDTDGLDYVFEAGANVPSAFYDVDSYDPNDEINDPSASVLPDSDADLALGGDLDYRDPNFVNPPSDAAIDFDGIDDHVITPAFLGGRSEVTVMGWLKMDSGFNSTGVVAGEEMFYIYIRNNGTPRLHVETTGGTNADIQASSGAANKNEWVHVTATFDASANEARLYVNGELEATLATSGVLSSGTDDFTIGRRSDGSGSYYEGAIDEVRVFSSALNDKQIQRLVYQEIEQNGTEVAGKIIPKLVSEDGGTSILWNDVEAYYPMTNIVTGRTTDISGKGRNAFLKNITTFQTQTAPMPYQTSADGAWTSQSTWLHGDVWDIDYINDNKDWAIVQINNDVTTVNDHRLLGLSISGSASLSVNNDNSIINDWYLEIDGKIDLQGESQLIQTEESTLEVTSAGTIEKDQQGTTDQYTYNYFSSPVGVSNVVQNNADFITAMMRDQNGNLQFTNSIDVPNPQTTPITLSSAWIYTFNDSPAEDYNSWSYTGNTNAIPAGMGFTLKGSQYNPVTSEQTYIFEGKPNNGVISHSISGTNQSLLGNPYPSALDCDEFIDDNINAITGTLYFWEHYGGNSHVLEEYQGGYAVYTKAGGVMAVAHPDVSQTGAGTRQPTRYMPVGQGFFVEADADGGTIEFNNSQRTYRTEGPGNSIFIRGSSDEGNTEESEDQMQRIRFGIENSEGFHRQLLLAFAEDATDGIDKGYDGKLNEEQLSDAFWMIQGQPHIIQAVKDLKETYELALGLKVHQKHANENITFMIDALENIEADNNIYIKDKLTGDIHDLRDDSFSIALEAGAYLDRFVITFERDVALSNDDFIETDDFNISYANNVNAVIIENSKGIFLKKLVLYGIQGQRIMSQIVNSNDSRVMIPVQGGHGTFIMEITTEKGNVTKKLITN